MTKAVDKAKLSIVRTLANAGTQQSVTVIVLAQFDAAVESARRHGYTEATKMALLCASNCMIGGEAA